MSLPLEGKAPSYGEADEASTASVSMRIGLSGI